MGEAKTILHQKQLGVKMRSPVSTQVWELSYHAGQCQVTFKGAFFATGTLSFHVTEPN